MVARVVALAPRGDADRCPGALHAIVADDGALVRVRVPGGYLEADALDALADVSARFGNGDLDITARANVQVRGLREADLEAVASALAAAGLLPSVEHERVRNINGNTFAGADPGELVDVRPLVAALDRALLADPLLASLPAKFLFAINGGGRGCATRGADLVAGAVIVEGASRFAISIAGEERTLLVDAGDVVEVLIELSRHAETLARAQGRAPGTWRLATLSASCDRIPARLATRVRAVALAANRESSDMPLGVIPSVDGRVNLVPAIPLGRIDAVQAHALALVARESGGDVRLAPWRGIVLGNLLPDQLPRLCARLKEVGLSLVDDGGYAGVAACAGLHACDAAHADVRHDAATYARTIAALRSHERVEGAWTVNFAGCEKRCAMRRGADAELVASATGYDVRVRGERVAQAGDADAAIAAVVAARATAYEGSRT